MKKFYNEPEMALKRFEAEDIVTASETQTNGNAYLSDEYAVATGTLVKRNSAQANVILQFTNTGGN